MFPLKLPHGALGTSLVFLHNKDAIPWGRAGQLLSFGSYNTLLVASEILASLTLILKDPVTVAP
jgi:hypothetical protein